jgi:hypothetical protein
MSTFPNSPRVLKGGLVLIDAATGLVQRIVTLQYNPESLTRSLQAQATGESGDRSEALRLKAPPVETYKLDADIDATDQLEFPDRNRVAVEAGLHPVLSAIESVVYPPSARLVGNNQLARSGTLEIAPVEAPLTLFVWSRNRIVPVRLTEFSIAEEAFDAALNPVRAKVSLSMRVLSVHDLGFDHRGGNLFLIYQRQKEGLASRFAAGTFGALGIGGIG